MSSNFQWMHSTVHFSKASVLPTYYVCHFTEVCQLDSGKCIKCRVTVGKLLVIIDLTKHILAFKFRKYHLRDQLVPILFIRSFLKSVAIKESILIIFELEIVFNFKNA